MPTLGVLLAVGLGIGLPFLDGHARTGMPGWLVGYLFAGGPEAARTVLSALAGSLITVTSLTFSLTVVTLQLASGQFSPRLLRTFARDPVVQACLTVLLATFTYAITVLRTVRGSTEDRTAFVPQISVTVAYVLGVASVFALVIFLAHIARQIRVEGMLREVHAETRVTMDRVLAGSAAPEASGFADTPGVPSDAVPLCIDASGFFTYVDEAALRSAATAAGAVVYLDRLPGDGLVAGVPVAAAWPAPGEPPLTDDARADLQRCLCAALHTGFERTAAQDVAFGLRQLVDVAVKALSPGVNDPTTAVHALDHIAALLVELSRHDLRPRVLCDADGTTRVVVRRPGFAELLDLGVAQPRRFGAGDPEVLLRLFALLRELAWATGSPDHHREIAGQLTRLLGTAEQQSFDDAERDRLRQEAAAVRLALAGIWRWNASPVSPSPGAFMQ
ncbi:hypothetical protein GCM10012284_37780 [Mangrovihabitans endophyticus]|uniref:DUF2254 domain-containing protein n=1 Tax=Mangrovihabitans endophyticus TaxID=1751298 RepID=A0A8J3C263_9ACTN|nr:hypothetical protein GCM10012284_37780 [Mangrovihabitans endophyticus]